MKEKHRRKKLMEFFQKKQKIREIIFLFFIISAIPLTVFLAQKVQDIRNRAAGEQTSLYFTTTDARRLTTLSLIPGEEKTINLYLDAHTYDMSGFDLAINFGSGVTLLTVVDGTDLARFNTEVFRVNDGHTLRLTRVRNDTATTLTGVLQLATLTLVAQNTPTSGTISFTTTMVTSPSSQTALTTDAPTLPYSVVESTPTSTPTPPPIGGGVDNTVVGNVTLASTYESISVYAPFSGDANGNNTATLRWRKVGDGAWKQGMDMTVDRRDLVISSEFSKPNPVKNHGIASVLGLSPNTQYEVQVAFADPDGVSGTNPLLQTITTRNDSYPSTGATFYVAPTGSDTNSGTEASPFKTIQKGVDSADAGNTVLVKSGTYQEKVTVSKSGSQSNFITIKNFGSDKPLIDATANPQSCGDGDGSNAKCGFLISGNFIHLSGFEITKARIGIKIDSPAQHVVIENNNIHDTIFVSRPSMPVKVGFNNDNEVKNITISGNTVVAAPGDPAGHAIEFHGTKGGNVIRNNTISFTHPGTPGLHGSDCVGGAPNDAIWGLGPDTDIYNNTCIGATDDGLEIEGGAMNNRVWGNKVVRANNAIAIAAVIVGPAYIFRNTLYDSALHWTGRCGGVKTGEKGTGAAYFYHNTFYLADPANACNGKSTSIASGGGGEDSLNVFYRNNIFHGFDRSISIGEATTQNLDYNLHYDEDHTGSILQYISSYTNFNTFQTARGQEQHGYYGRPTYQNEAGKDFRLASGSLGIDTGVVIAGFNDATSPWPFTGSAPDIGAYESGSVGGPVPTATATPNPTVTPTPIQSRPTPTPTSGPIPTQNATLGSLTIRVRVQGLESRAQTLPTQTMRVTIRQGATQVRQDNAVSFSADSLGVYSATIANLQPGTYDVLVKRPYYLQKKFASVVVGTGTNTLDRSSVRLLVGDFNNDNRLDITDVSDVINNYTALSAERPGDVFDINGDGRFDIQDVSFVVANLTAITVTGDN